MKTPQARAIHGESAGSAAAPSRSSRDRGAHYLHGAFAELASGQRESMRVWWGIALLYNTFGPAVTVGLVGLVGAALTWTGMRRLC